MILSVVIPLYNEEHRFQRYFPELYKHISSLYSQSEFEFVCINDGSQDKTKTIIEKYRKEYSGIRHFNVYKNKGKGYALRLGVRQARGDMIFFTDIDLSADIT